MCGRPPPPTEPCLPQPARRSCRQQSDPPPPGAQGPIRFRNVHARDSRIPGCEVPQRQSHPPAARSVSVSVASPAASKVRTGGLVKHSGVLDSYLSLEPTEFAESIPCALRQNRLFYRAKSFKGVRREPVAGREGNHCPFRLSGEFRATQADACLSIPTASGSNWAEFSWMTSRSCC